jgi:hypothetical protein
MLVDRSFGHVAPSISKRLPLLEILPITRVGAFGPGLQRRIAVIRGIRGTQASVKTRSSPIKSFLACCCKTLWTSWPASIAASPWVLWQLQLRPALALVPQKVHGSDKAQNMAPVLHRMRVIRRTVFLLCLLTPLALFYPFTRLSTRVRNLWMWAMYQCLQWAGPAFTKWGQWAAGRPDLLPLHLRQLLETLHTTAPSHPGHETMRILRASLPLPPEQLFDELEVVPFASGAVAQVHRATLSQKGADLCGRTPGEVR